MTSVKMVCRLIRCWMLTIRSWCRSIGSYLYSVKTYRGLQFLAGRETGKTWIEGRIIDREGNDITDLVREAENYLIKHTFL